MHLHRKATSMALGLALLLAGLAVPAAAAAQDDHSSDKVTVRGEILDMACFVSHGAQGPDHAACAKRCVKGGQPMGLLAEDGQVYLLYANHQDPSAFEEAKEHAGEKVEITGVPGSQGAFKGLEVDSVKVI